MANLSLSGAPAEFRIGSVLSRGFGVFGSAAGRFFMLALIANLPLLLFSLWVLTGNPTDRMTVAIASLIAGFLQIFVGFVVQGAIVYGAFQEMRGHGFTVGDSISKCLARAVPLFGLALLTSLATMIGLILLVIPGLIIMTMFYVSPPACVVERLGPTDSMRRSAELTKGYRWKIFALFLVITIASYALLFLAELIAGNLVPQFGVELLNYLLTSVVSAIGSVLVAIAYHDLRVIKEGISLDSIASVFD